MAPDRSRGRGRSIRPAAIVGAVVAVTIVAVAVALGVTSSASDGAKLAGSRPGSTTPTTEAPPADGSDETIPEGSFRPDEEPPPLESSDAPPPAPVFCNPTTTPVPLTTPVTDPLVVTTGIPGAPTYYEFALPPAPYTTTPKGYMLLVHGGGWYEHGPIKVEQLRPEADLWRKRGWATLTVTYRPCAQAMGDVFWYYEQLRQRAGSTVPICAMGQSSGAHLVILLAGTHPDLDCAISQAGPLDLVGLPLQLAYDNLSDGDAPPTGPLQAAWPRWAFAIAIGVFGFPNDQWHASPLTWANGVQARLLLATASNDRVIPLDQARNYAAGLRAVHPDAFVDVVELPIPEPGDRTHPFVHGSTTPDAWADYRAEEEALVAPLVGGG